MPLESHLLPGESVRFRASRSLSYGQSSYTAYVTDKRLVLYAERGLLRRADVVTFNLRDVSGSRYHESGLFSKTGHLNIAVGNTSATVYGPAIDVKQLMMQAQNPLV